MASVWSRRLHQVACLSTTALVSWLVFSDISHGWIAAAWLLLPLSWAAFALDMPTLVCGFVVVDIAAAIGRNPYAHQAAGPVKASLLLIITLVFGSGFTGALAAVAAARRRDHAALVQLNLELDGRIAAAVADREAAVVQTKRLKRLRALAQVAGGVAHEFNNILQTISGALEMIKRRPADTDRVSRMAELALTAAGRGGVITRRLLGFAHRAPLHATETDLAAMLTGLREPFSDMLGTSITLNLEPDLPLLLIDRDELEIALVNLASNARDAMPGGGTLAISATVVTLNGSAHPRATLAAGRYLCVAVSDTGTGMTPDILARATEPFFTTKPFGQGSGLGLSMAKGFAEQSGGGLTIESAPGAGTTVTLWLPAGDG